jgi:DNA-binding response OmpR family regulator
MNKKIVLVEDDQFLRDLIISKLTKAGFIVKSAIDGEAGVHLIDSENPDLIICDLLMPNMDGFAVLEKVRKNSATEKTPVIVFSNLSDPESIKKAQAFQVADFMIKSNFTLDELITRMQELLGK